MHVYRGGCSKLFTPAYREEQSIPIMGVGVSNLKLIKCMYIEVDVASCAHQHTERSNQYQSGAVGVSNLKLIFKRISSEWAVQSVARTIIIIHPQIMHLQETHKYTHTHASSGAPRWRRQHETAHYPENCEQQAEEGAKANRSKDRERITAPSRLV